MIKKELVNYQNRLFWIKRRVRENHINSEYITPLKEYWMCDIVLRQNNNSDGYLLFLVEIPDAQIVE